jgi:hypothetical protein
VADARLARWQLHDDSPATLDPFLIERELVRAELQAPRLADAVRGLDVDDRGGRIVVQYGHQIDGPRELMHAAHDQFLAGDDLADVIHVPPGVRLDDGPNVVLRVPPMGHVARVQLDRLVRSRAEIRRLPRHAVGLLVADPPTPVGQPRIGEDGADGRHARIPFAVNRVIHAHHFHAYRMFAMIDAAFWPSHRHCQSWAPPVATPPYRPTSSSACPRLMLVSVIDSPSTCANVDSASVLQRH